LTVAGPGTFIDEILTLAGGRNIVPEGGRAWSTPSREWLSVAAPVAVVVPESMVAALDLPSESRVLPIDPDRYHVAGLHLPRAAADLMLRLDPLRDSKGGAS
jgi:ABC-type hemin transport system substrate-binding protein